MAVHIETDAGVAIYSARQWRAHVCKGDHDGVKRFFDGLDELAYTWCAGGVHGVPEEVAALLASAWPEVNTTRIVATPQIPTGLAGTMFWADLVLNASTSGGGVVAIVVSGKRSRESEAPLANAEPTLAADLSEEVFGRAFFEGRRPDPELARLPLRLAMASAAALHTAKVNGASTAAVISHEIVTPMTSKEDVSLSRSMLFEFARALGIEDLQPGVLARAATSRAAAGRPSLWLGLCIRTMPAVPWIN